MGFVADLLMYKIQRADQMSDLQKAQQAMSGQMGTMATQPGQMSAQQAIWGGGLGMGQPSQMEGVQTSGQMGKKMAAQMMGLPADKFGNPPAALDMNNVPMAPTGYSAQGMAPQGWQPSGLMGQSQMANALLSSPTTAGMFPQMMNAYFSNQNQMAMQRQAQDWRLANEMPFNRETQLQLQEMQGSQAMARSMADWRSPEKMQTRETALRKEYQGYAKPLEQSMDRYAATTNMIQNRGGDWENVTGADAIAMVKDFAKTILPNEAVMSGDEQAIAQAAQSTFGGSVDTWINKLNGKSPITPAELSNMYRLMGERNALNQQNLAGLQQQYTSLSGAYGLNAQNVVGQQIYQGAQTKATAQPGTTPLTHQSAAVADIPAPGAGQSGVPDDLVPVETQMFGKPQVNTSNRRKNRGQR